MSRSAVLLIAAYLGAIVLANGISAHYGAGASIYNAFFMIGLTLTVRDRLHDLWRGHRLRNMALLIATGSVISYVAALTINSSSVPSDIVARIALASCVAFAVAEGMDALFYQALRFRPWLERSNTSNVLSALLDSMIFVSIAFGWSWPVIFGQVCAKVAGGFVWSLVIRYFGHVPEVEPISETA
jgi:uncharacterized PurR-regulated membrane protein YhhQ (DUF165 family)